MDKVIDKLPTELHIPGYQFCGPGTKLNQRLKRGDSGINELDSACKNHDIAYSTHKSGIERRKADKILGEKAWSRFKASDSTLGEKINALAVSGIMKAKSTLGLGLRGKNGKNASQKSRPTKQKIKTQTPHTKSILQKAIANAADAISTHSSSSLANTSKFALDAAKAIIRKQRIPKEKLLNSAPRIIPVPKIGGVLPLIPIFAGLSALGSLIGGASSIAKAVKITQNVNDNLEETIRHNKAMEAITLGKTKTGNGLYLRPYRNGLGLYIKPYAGLGYGKNKKVVKKKQKKRMNKKNC